MNLYFFQKNKVILFYNEINISFVDWYRIILFNIPYVLVNFGMFFYLSNNVYLMHANDKIENIVFDDEFKSFTHSQ